MKRLLVGDYREEVLTTLEIILRHWGYRTVSSSQPEQLGNLLRETSPDLIIIGSRLLSGEDSPLAAAVADKVVASTCPLIVLGERGMPETLDVPHESLEVPIDVFALFALIQKHIEKHPRKNLRLTIKLPGVFCSGDTCNFAEILSLSIQGLFIKTGARLERGGQLTVIFPLLGMKKELELDGRVLYRIEPTAENNYLHGVGIEFTPMERESEETLRRFIECCFLGELSASQGHGEGLDGAQIETVAPELTLSLARH